MRGEIGIVAVRTATILHVSSPSFFSRYMQYTVSIAQNPASVKGERRFSARQCQRHRPPCPFLQRIRFLPADRCCPPGRNRTRRTEISINAYPCGRNPHFLSSFRAPAWRSARGLCRFFARPFCKKADILRRSALSAAPPVLCYPRGSAFSSALHSRPGRIHGAPGSAICLSPSAPETAALCTPRARRHALRTVCPLPRYPPPRPFRRRIPSRHGPRVAPTPPAVYAERQHRTCRRPRRGPVPAAAHLQGFSRGLFAKRPTTRAAALYLPHLPSSAPPRRGFPH